MDTIGKSNTVAITSVCIQCHQVTEHSVFIQPASGESISHPSCSSSLYIIPTYRTYWRPFVRLYSATLQSKDRFITPLNVT